MFKSPMVNQYNFDTFVCGGDNDELAQRLVERKKPFASFGQPYESPADLTYMIQLHERLRNEPHLKVSPLRLYTTKYRNGRKIHELVFEACQAGTLEKNFDMKALAKFYHENVGHLVSRDVRRKIRFELFSYFNDWDWQDRTEKYTGSVKRPPWSEQREPPVEPWETGLILGYPPMETVEAYYDYHYLYRPTDPEKTIRDYVERTEAYYREHEDITFPTVKERKRDEKHSYKILRGGNVQV